MRKASNTTFVRNAFRVRRSFAHKCTVYCRQDWVYACHSQSYGGFKYVTGPRILPCETYNHGSSILKCWLKFSAYLRYRAVLSLLGFPVCLYPVAPVHLATLLVPWIPEPPFLACLGPQGHLCHPWVLLDQRCQASQAGLGSLSDPVHPEYPDRLK